MNITTLNTIGLDGRATLNICSLNVIGEIRRKKPSSGGGDAPEGYEVLMASDGAIEATDGVIYVKS